MALKNLVVVVDQSAQSAARVNAAILLATKHDAHLTGLFVASPPVLLTRLRGLGVGKEAKSLISNECRCESLHYTVIAYSTISLSKINHLRRDSLSHRVESAKTG